MCFIMYLKGVVFGVFWAALIPLREFSEPVILKKYGVKPDSETLDIANTAAAQKEVQCLFLKNPFEFSKIVRFSNNGN